MVGVMELNDLQANIQGMRLHVHQPDGSLRCLGVSGPVINWHLHCPNTLRSILKHPEISLGESYVRGEWDIDTSQLSRLIQALVPAKAPRTRLANRLAVHRLRAHLPHWRKTPRCEMHWLNCSVWLSRLCLGEEMFQGTARYSEAGMNLEQAQRRKARHVLEQLQLKQGHHVLDLNAGWGSLALFLAQQADVRVTALVETREQMQYAEHQTRNLGLQGQVHFRLGNFNQCRGHFDRILAADFIEQHTQPTYPVLLRHLEDLLVQDGFLWLQLTGRSRDVALSHYWYQKQLPSPHSLPLMSELTSALESTRLRMFHLEDQTSHCLQTVQDREQRFYHNRAEISRRFGETYTRTWEFMLASQHSTLRWRQTSSYEMVLGNLRSRWPAANRAEPCNADNLLPDISNAIPGLTRQS